MVPLLALGIPFAPPTAMLMSALTIHGVQPGPLFMKQCPDIFWGVIASMYIGNVVLLILNLPLVSVFASIMRIPQHLLMGIILVLCLVGSFSINNSFLDIYILVAMGLVGYVLRKLKFDMAPLILGLVLGPMIEKTFRQALFMARGDLWLLLQRPITAVLLTSGLPSSSFRPISGGGGPGNKKASSPPLPESGKGLNPREIGKGVFQNAAEFLFGGMPFPNPLEEFSRRRVEIFLLAHDDLIFPFLKKAAQMENRKPVLVFRGDRKIIQDADPHPQFNVFLDNLKIIEHKNRVHL